LEYQTLIYEKSEGIGTVTINRPQSLNALNFEAYRELYGLFLEIEADAEVRAVIMTGCGEKAFVAGTDITSMVNLTPAEAHQFAQHLRKACDLISNSNKPVIAAVNGFALGGGCELALCADFRIASENARFGQPEINLAIIPGSGGTQRLSRLIGLSRAKELIFYGGMIDAGTALNWGLVSKVVPPSDLMKEAREMAVKLLTKSSPIFALAKKAMNSGINTDLSTGFDLEALCFAECFATEDQKEGMQAFLEKRKACFNNK
jgi:enoyl-CoA hydratase